MVDWAEELDADGRGAFRRAVAISFAAHAAALLLLAFSPALPSSPTALPGVVTVDLVSAAPGPAPARAPAPKPAAEKPPEPKPEPVAPPKPPPPVEKKVVLPKEATTAPEKVVEKPKPKAPPKDYDALMKELRDQRGESRPEVVETAEARPAPAAPAGGGGTVRVSPEVAAWVRDARIHVRKAWVKAPGFERLQTTLVVTLDSSGNVIGEPVVKERSGNPYYDDSVVRAIQKASPLPRPPTAGEWTFQFPSEESA